MLPPPKGVPGTWSTVLQVTAEIAPTFRLHIKVVKRILNHSNWKSIRCFFVWENFQWKPVTWKRHDDNIGFNDSSVCWFSAHRMQVEHIKHHLSRYMHDTEEIKWLGLTKKLRTKLMGGYVMLWMVRFPNTVYVMSTPNERKVQVSKWCDTSVGETWRASSTRAYTKPAK